MSERGASQDRSPVAEAVGDEGIRLLADLSKDELIRIIIDDAKNWLAHDGLWFQAVEKSHGMEAAIAADVEAWRSFTVHRGETDHGAPGDEAGRRHTGSRGMPQAPPLRATQPAGRDRTDRYRVVFRMLDCRVQSARKRRGLADFPCRPVGMVEYAEFAKAIDPRIKMNCVACPPDDHPEEYWCAWEFTIDEA